MRTVSGENEFAYPCYLSDRNNELLGKYLFLTNCLHAGDTAAGIRTTYLTPVPWLR